MKDRTITDMADLDPAELEELKELAERTREIDALAELAHKQVKRRILDMRLEGWAVKPLTEATGLSHQRVYQVLNRAGNST